MEGEFKDTAEEITLDVVKKRTVSGIVFLTMRTFVLQVLGFLGTAVFLPLYLQKGEYGVFIIVTSVISFLQYFSDIGLAAALVQKKDNVTDDELKTTFTVQQFLVILVVLLAIGLTPFIKIWQKLDDQSVYLLYAVALSFLLSSLKTIPSVLLERKLEFGKLVIPQIAETLLFNVIAVFFAWRGFGIMSFTYAVLVRGFVGLILMYILQPWKPGLAFNREALKRLLRFGIPYQANSFLAVFKDDGMTLVLGGIVGKDAIGLLGWAKKWAEAPLRFFMDQVIRVTFPAYSRMQHDTKELEKAVSKSIFFICFLVFPTVIGLFLLAPLIIAVVPRYEQWKPALILFAFLGVNVCWAAVTTPLTNVLNAIGKVRITFYLMIMWTILTWIFVPGLAYLYGITGAAIGYAIVGTSSIVAIIVARKYVPIDILNSTIKPLLSAVAMGVVLYIVRHLMVPSLAWILILVIFGSLTYFLGNVFLLGPILIKDSKKVIYAILKKD